jgi:methyl-accepting chemotaxis protein
MAFNIRKKMLLALLSVSFVFIAFAVFIESYNLSVYYKGRRRVESTSSETDMIGRLHHSVERMLMPANDYIITGDRQYMKGLQKESGEITRLLRDIDARLASLEKEGSHSLDEKKAMLNDVRLSWEKIMELSLKIFAIKRPSGSRLAASLMEEMDYKYGSTAAKTLERWRGLNVNELREALKDTDTELRQSWLVMAGAFIALTAGSAFFASFYSKRFVSPIRELQKGSEDIAAGRLGFRLIVKTGDEIQALAERFNAMAERLQGSYSLLEQRVAERTRELREERDALEAMVREKRLAEEELKARLDELERFQRATIGRELRIKELKDEIAGLREEVRRLQSKVIDKNSIVDNQ